LPSRAPNTPLPRSHGTKGSLGHQGKSHDAEGWTPDQIAGKTGAKLLVFIPSVGGVPEIKDYFGLFDYDVYAMCGDGDMMEGISNEAASLAGHLKLGNLCWIYDNNKITIEGHTEWAFSEDVATRFIGYGWNVTRVGDANDLEMLDRAFDTARRALTTLTSVLESVGKSLDARPR
jgi:hypothetical protein